MSEAMELSERNFQQIGSYVREHLGTWIREISPAGALPTDPVMLERIVRVEEELKSQRELMKQGFEAVDLRFESVDKRFESVDKRFESVDKRFEELRGDMNARFEEARHRTNVWMTVITIFLGLMTVAVTVTNLM